MLVDPLGVSVPPSGPRGGKLDAHQNPDARQTGLNVVDLGGGIMSLHKQEGFKDTADNGIKDCQPWHVMAAQMMLAGLSQKDIARTANVSESHLSTLKAQRWFQEMLAIEAAKTGKSIANIIQSEVLSSIQTIVEIRDDINSGVRARLQAATTLLEQGNGKAVQKNINFTATTSFSSLEEEEKALKEELKAIRQSIPQNLLEFPESLASPRSGVNKPNEDANREAIQLTSPLPEDAKPEGLLLPSPSPEDARSEASFLSSQTSS